MKRLVLLIFLLALAAPSHALILAGVLGSGGGGGGTTYTPNTPTIGTATAGNASASVAFTPGTVDGSHSAATSYTATSTPGSITGTGSTSPITVNGLTNGTAYTFSVTATNSAGTSGASAASNSVTPAAGSTNGLIDFETASLTPTNLTGAYVNSNSTYASRSSNAAHGGIYSMMFTAATSSPYGELVRSVTFPSSGTYTFTRWVNVSALTNTNDDLTLFSLSPDTTPSTFSVIIQYHDNVNPSTGGIRFGSSSGYTVLYPSSSMAANTWYRVVASLNCAANTYDITVYDSTGTQLASVTGRPVYAGSFGNSTRYIYTGRSYTSGAPTYYVDDMIDGL